MLRGAWSKWWWRVPATLIVSDIVLNAGIFLCNARDNMLVIYTADPMFTPRCLIIGVLVCIPLLLVLEAARMFSKRELPPILAMFFILAFFVTMVVTERYEVSAANGFLAGIDNVWLQFASEYGLSLAVACTFILVPAWLYVRRVQPKSDDRVDLDLF